MRDGNPNIHALDKYYPEMCETAKNILAQGKSYAAVAAALEICEDTIYDWHKKHPEFHHACKVGRAKGQAFWEQDSDDNMQNKDYCSTRYIFKMKSQYKIKDGSEPIKQDNTTNTHMLFGMEAAEHKEMVERILGDAKERGE